MSDSATSVVTPAKGSSQEGIKRGNFLKKYKLHKSGTESDQGSSTENPIVISDLSEEDLGEEKLPPIKKQQKKSKHTMPKWLYGMVMPKGGRNIQSGSKSDSEVTKRSIMDESVEALPEEYMGNSEPNLVEGEEDDDDEDDEDQERRSGDQYFTFQPHRVNGKLTNQKYEEAEKQIFSHRKQNKIMKFFSTPAKTNPFGKLIGGKHKNKPMDLQLFDTNIKSMPMLNAFERNNGQWRAEEKNNSSDSDDESSDEYEGEFDGYDDEAGSPLRHTMRRSERMIGPDGMSREVVEEEFIERTEKGTKYNGNDDRMDDPWLTSKKDHQARNKYGKLKFNRNLRDYKYYVDGVHPYLVNSQGKAISNDEVTKMRKLYTDKPLPRPMKKKKKSKHSRHSSKHKSVSKEMSDQLWYSVHKNYNLEILKFHDGVRKMLALIPILSYFVPFLNLLQVAIPKENESEFTSPSALVVAVIDGVIGILSLYWGMRIYVFIAHFFRNVLWLFVKVGIV